MIGKLIGIVENLREDALILDVQGVGYLVFASQSTLKNLQTSSHKVSLYIETVVKEDSLTLLEQTWFKLLQTVQGVGARLALVLLSHFTPSHLYQIILREDKTNLTEADGVGSKLAVRLITELKDLLFKSPNLKGDEEYIPSLANSWTPSYFKEHTGSLEGDALSALENLGYPRENVLKVIQDIYQAPEPPKDLKELIRLCLKHLSSLKGANS